MNHCYYYGTVKTNTSMHLNSSAWGTPQFGLSLGPSHWCCGKPQVLNVSHRCVVSDPHLPAPPAKTPFQVTCNISHRLYRPSTLPWTSHRKRGNYEEWLNCKSSIYPATPSPTLKLPLLSFHTPLPSRVCELRRVASRSSTTFCPRYKDVHIKHFFSQPTLHTYASD